MTKQVPDTPMFFFDFFDPEFIALQSHEQEALIKIFDLMPASGINDFLASDMQWEPDELRGLLQVNTPVELNHDKWRNAHKSLNLLDIHEYWAYINTKGNQNDFVVIDNSIGYYYVGSPSDQTVFFRLPLNITQERKLNVVSDYFELPTVIDVATIHKEIGIEPNDVWFVLVDIDNTRFAHIIKVEGSEVSNNSIKWVLVRHANRLISRRIFKTHKSAYDYAKVLKDGYYKPFPHPEFMITLGASVKD